MKPFATWTVLPHGKLTRLEDNVLSVTGTMHMGNKTLDGRPVLVEYRLA